jgi:hypothetical protein
MDIKLTTLLLLPGMDPSPSLKTSFIVFRNKKNNNLINSKDSEAAKNPQLYPSYGP